MVSGILHHIGGSQILLVAFKFLAEQLGGINACGLGVSDLLLVEDKTVYILLEGLFLDLLLIVLVIKVLKRV